MTALDANVLIASLLPSHTHFQRSAARVEELLARGERFLIPGSAVRECYSVLTRLPASVRLSPRDAFAVIESTVRPPASILDTTLKTWPLLEWASRAGIVSGQIHDAHIAHIAAAAGATTLLTWNVRHMRVAAPPELIVREP